MEIERGKDGGDLSAKSCEDVPSIDHPRHVEQSMSNRLWKYKPLYTWTCIVLLLVNYFLAQYDKFILSYFQTPLSQSLGL